MKHDNSRQPLNCILDDFINFDMHVVEANGSSHAMIRCWLITSHYVVI